MRAPSSPWAMLLLAIATFSTAAPGCKAKPGDSCQMGTAACMDERTQLACQDGKLIATPCKGAKGCATRGSLVECDVSGNAEGDVCSTGDENKGACTADGESLVSCRDGKYQVMACRGPKGCRPSPTGWSCDSSAAEEGDRCSGEGSACAVDGKRMLSCQGGRYAMKWNCRGPAGCKDSGDGQLHCDFSIAEVGDACDSEGGACTADGKQLLRCEEGKFAAQSLCRGPKGCKDEGTTLSCDSSLAEVGDPCDPDDGACAVDGKAFLECKEGKYAATQRCACVVEGGIVRCK